MIGEVEGLRAQIQGMYVANDAMQKERDRLDAELRSIVLNGTHANHKYETCGVCMAERALGMPVEEAYVRNLPPRKRAHKAGERE